MITEAILNLLLVPIWGMLRLYSPMAIPLILPALYFEGLNNLLSCIGFVLPVAALSPILVTSLVFRFGHVAWAMIIRIKSFIPTMGA